MDEKTQKILDWKTNKPKNDNEWKEDVKAESLHIKFVKQLDEMEESLTKKLPKVQKDLDKFTNWPDVVRYELTEQFTQMFEDAKVDDVIPDTVEGKTLQEWVDGEFQEQLNYYTWKINKLGQSVERIQKEKQLRKDKKVTRQEIG